MENLPVTQNTTQQEDKVKMVRYATLGIGVIALALFMPVIWMAVQAGVGLIALGVLGIIGVGFFQSMPLIMQKWENKLLAMRKSEARKNPIEQLQNFLREKAERVAQFKRAVTAIGAQIKGLEDMLMQRKKDKPNADVSRQETALVQMKNAHKLLITKYQKAEEALVQLKDVIDEEKFKWQFGQAGQMAISSLSSMSGQDLMNQMLADEAFSSVRDNFNQVFSELEMEAAKINSQNQISYDAGMTLDLSAIEIPLDEKVRVR